MKIQLTESELRGMIKEMVEKVISESSPQLRQWAINKANERGQYGRARDLADTATELSRQQNDIDNGRYQYSSEADIPMMIHGGTGEYDWAEPEYRRFVDPNYDYKKADKDDAYITINHLKTADRKLANQRVKALSKYNKDFGNGKIKYDKQDFIK